MKLKLGILGLAAIATALTTAAQTISDDFSDGNDEGWTHYEPLSSFGGGGTYTFPDGAYRIQAGPSPSPTFGPARAGSLRSDLVVTDFQITFDLLQFDSSRGQFTGALVRGGNLGLATSTGYLMGYDEGDLNQLVIARINEEAIETVVATGPVNLDAEKDYRFILTGNGTSLSVSVIDLSNPSTVLAMAEGSDSAYASGVFGLLVFDTSDELGATADATFDNVQVEDPNASEIYGIWQFNGNLDRAEGVGELTFATPESQTAITFQSGPIGEENANFAVVPMLAAGKHGLLLTMPTFPNGGGEYLNQYTLVWDVFIPEPLNWTPLFNTNPDLPTDNDADFYVANDGSIGIGELGYSPVGIVQAGQWYRIGFVADLPAGVVTYYVNGSEVFERTGASLTDGRFAMFTSNDDGPDVLLFSEPTGEYNHPLNVNSFLFINRTLTGAEMLALNGPGAEGISLPTFGEGALLSISREGANVNLSWTGGKPPYQLQKATTLTNPQWTNLGNESTETTATDTISGDTAFYRVVSQP